MVLQRQIDRLRSIQSVYIIGIESWLAEVANESLEEPEDINLWFPSSFTRIRRTEMCWNDIADIEAKLWESQCQDALNKLGNQLRTKMHCIKQRNTNIHGQRANTRANALIDRLTTKIDTSAAKYRAARKALWKLCGDGDWMHELRELKPDDIRGPGESASGEIEEENGKVRAGSRRRSKKATEATRRGLGEGYKMISWIWTIGGVTNGDDDLTLNNGELLHCWGVRAKLHY